MFEYNIVLGNLHYLHISKPEPLVNYEEMKNQEDYVRFVIEKETKCINLLDTLGCRLGYQSK